MVANNRIFYASQAVLLKPQGAGDGSLYASWLAPKGVQSAGITTNFTLEQVFQLGQIELYDNVEEVPEVEVTLNKVLDGTMPLYLMCMGGQSGPATANNAELSTLTNNRVNFRLGIFADTTSLATGSPRNYVDCSGMYLSSVSYTFPVDGNSTEDVTLVGNNKIWNSDAALGAPSSSADSFDLDNVETAPAIARRYKFNYGISTLPTGVGGIKIPTDRTNNRPYLQSVTVSMDLGREAINELGSMAPYHRFPTFPVEVTSEFEIVASDGDLVDASDFSSVAASCDTSYKNLVNKPVVVGICGTGTNDTLVIDLGDKNKLTSVNYTGGDAGGGNATITYSFQTFNKFVVRASGSYTGLNVAS